MVRTRIAPSPTGENLHIGNVYTALLNYIFAKKNNGQFIIRIEDTDRQRIIPGSEERILKSLKWLGIKYDEGPDIGGSFGPYRQSERLPYYQKYAQELIAKKAAYYCFCTAEILEKMKTDQISRKEIAHYDRRCKKLTAVEVQKKLDEGEIHVIRLAVPDSGVTTFHDLVRGDISFENKLIDDQVLLKSDGYPTYHLGVVVDDYLMKISHVIRAEEWISSTPKHVLIYQALNWDLPVFCHGPILRNPDKSKLSKRKNPVWVSWYKEQGFLPEAILNYLAQMGWSMAEGKEIFTLDEMKDSFKLEDLKPVGPAFDITKLEWMNGEYIRKCPMNNLQLKMHDFFNGKYSKEEIKKTLPLVSDRMKKLKDWEELTIFFRSRPETFEETPNKTYLAKIIPILEKSVWEKEFMEVQIRKLAQDMDIKAGELFMAIRDAITGKKATPPILESMVVLGKEESLVRLKLAISY